ncbi:MAG: MFS transporter [Gammaproteobacteria bacterium]
MIRSIWAVGSLLLSVAVLLFGHGMHLTLLPLVADSMQWSPSLNAATTSAYFLGFAAGCLIVPAWLRVIGHARVFTVLVAIATGTLLALILLPYVPAWLGLRFVYGIGISGIYLTVESWLNDATAAESRGTVLAVYSFVTLAAIFFAQLALGALALDYTRLLVLAAIFVVVAALPIGLTRRPLPVLEARPRIRLRTVLRRANLPAVATGVLTGTFWALAPLFVTRAGFAAAGVARFMAIAVAGGMLAVYPLGWLSDRVGRARLLAALGVAGLLATGGYLAFAGSEATLMLYGAAFGAIVMPLYALSIALANDLAVDADFVETGSVVILANATGMVLGPLLAGWLLGARSPAALPWFWMAGFVALLAGALAALRVAPRPQEDEELAAFELVPRSAPAVLQIDPRASAQTDAAAPPAAAGESEGDAAV